MTFVGFKVDEKGQCYDFRSAEVIEDCQVPVDVLNYLITQRVNLDCTKWTKYVN